MWTTALQIGELVELSQKVYDPTETRVLVTHASPGREGLLAQLALTLHVRLYYKHALILTFYSQYRPTSPFLPVSTSATISPLMNLLARPIWSISATDLCNRSKSL
jgi:hypothetical protein